MARRPKLEIDGQTFKNVYMVEYDIYTSIDETGRASNRPRTGLIKITRESDENTDIARWATSAAKAALKDGNIMFASPGKAKMKELKWKNGFVSKYIEVLPHTKANPDDQMYEYFEITCAKLSIGEVEIDNKWEGDLTVFD